MARTETSRIIAMFATVPDCKSLRVCLSPMLSPTCASAYHASIIPRTHHFPDALPYISMKRSAS